ncbi:MAG: hypothetical protein LBM94_00500 [Propionibacteriaceae bacterium]|jgi:hypothetical protein|nr:hypothetical protein [Propionibacteriaceae bacterium]
MSDQDSPARVAGDVTPGEVVDAVLPCVKARRPAIADSCGFTRIGCTDLRTAHTHVRSAY